MAFSDDGLNQPSTSRTNSAYTSNITEYQSTGSQPALRNRERRTPTYKGFTTSICDLFRSTNLHREDCCAFACCGVLSHDKSVYLATGRESSMFLAVLRHIVVPVMLFLLTAVSAVRIKDPVTNEKVTLLFFLTFVGYNIWNCVTGSLERVRFRRDLALRARDESASSGVASHTNGSSLLVEEQDEYSAKCAHGICGCSVCVCGGGCGAYSDDTRKVKAYYTAVGGDEDEEEDRDDACVRLWNFFSNCCCRTCCDCWFQFFGCCALAQEARELRKLLPRESQLIDFVTYEPFADYKGSLENLRVTKNNNLMDHYMALSQLSILLLKCLVLVMLALFILGLLDVPQGSAKFDNLLVALATFCQAFFIVYFCHWQWNRFDLSLDAVVKYFASGFLLTTGLALFFEFLESVVYQTILGFIAIITAPTYFNANDGNNNDTLMSQFSLKYPAIMIFYYFLSAYALASLVEELCKYFGFWMVEHPDFISPDEYGSGGYTYEQDADSQTGGSVSSSNSSEVSGLAQRHTTNTASSANMNRGVNNQIVRCPLRTLTSQGAGITVAMVAVAMGFACCENMIYIFVYTGDGMGSEFTVLILRSLFPVHPLSAAIQSIGVCRRDLEGDKSYGIGRSLFPAVLLHGSFDFALMIFQFIADANAGNDAAGDDGVGWALASLCGSFGIVLLGFLYYAKQSHAQNARLAALDAAIVSDQSHLT